MSSGQYTLKLSGERAPRDHDVGQQFLVPGVERGETLVGGPAVVGGAQLLVAGGEVIAFREQSPNAR